MAGPPGQLSWQRLLLLLCRRPFRDSPLAENRWRHHDDGLSGHLYYHQAMDDWSPTGCQSGLRVAGRPHALPILIIPFLPAQIRKRRPTEHYITTKRIPQNPKTQNENDQDNVRE